MQRLYFVEATDVCAVRIGCAKDPIGRLRILQAWTFHPLKMIATVPGGYIAEAYLHFKYRHHIIRGEWFRPRGDFLEMMDRAQATGLICGLPQDVPDGTRFRHVYALREIRERLGLSQDGLAAALGLTLGAIKESERSEYIANRTTGRIIALAEERGIHLTTADFLKPKTPNLRRVA